MKRKTPISIERIAIAVRLTILIWSASLLTASYFKIIPQIDSTFIAGLFTSTLSTFGIQSIKGSEDKSKPTNRPNV